MGIHSSSSGRNMKAAVICICLFVVCSSRVLNKRSLLGGHHTHGHGQGQHGHHQQHHQPHQRQQSRNLFGQRVGRDGDNHQDDSDDEIRAAPTGYLPADDDYEYEEDLTEEAATRSEDIAGYSDDNLSGYENGAAAEERDQAQYANEQGQYEDEQYQYDEASGEEELPEAAGSDSNIDNSYAAPGAGRAADDGYAAPEEAVPRDSYGAPAGSGAESEYSAPRAADEEYGAPGQYEGNQGSFPFAVVEERQGSGLAAAASGAEDTKVCPGGSLDACVEVCPGISARVYSACVQGCADRCPEI